MKKSIMEELRDKGLNCDSILIALSEMAEEFRITIEALRDKGLSANKILDILSNISELMHVLNLREEESVNEGCTKPMTNLEKENKLRNILLEMGMPRNINGYHYLVKAIIMYSDDPEQSFSLSVRVLNG